MFNCTRIKSVEYYEAQQRQADADDLMAGTALRPSEIGRDGERRDAVSYYQDNGAAEAPGVWFVHRRDFDPATGEVLATDPTSPQLPSPLAGLESGQQVDGKTLRRLAAAKDPATGQPIENSRTGKPLRPMDKDGQPKGSVGYDMQISAPKSVSVMAAAADEATRARIFAAHDRAIQKAMAFVVEDGLLYSRSGKGGHEREQAVEIAAAQYRHFTSRAGDPQLHTHTVWLNMARRADGSMGTIDNQQAVRYGGAVAALYRTELAAALKSEFGLEVEQSGRNFEIVGVSDAIIQRFSKRRQQIEKMAAEGGFDTEKNRQAAQIAAFDSRGTKDELPPLNELEKRWERELAAEGWTGESLWEAARAAARHHRSQVEAPEAPPSLLDRASKAVAGLMQNEAVFERRQLFRAVLEELQTTGATADEALGTIARMEAEGVIIKVGMDGNEAVYSTREMVELEQNMLRAAIERQNERQWIDAKRLDEYLDMRRQIVDKDGTVIRRGVNAEQEAAIRHVLNRDGVAVVEGLAGTGKSFSTLTMKELMEPLGFTVHGIAPSWKAAEVLRADAELAEEMSRAVAGFLNRLDKGEIVLDSNSIVLLDEAGMVGTEDMARLLVHTKAAGAKVILQGDTRQLQPVVAGAPMKALASALGAARLQDIQRQKGTSEAEGEWMRAASVDFATGDPVRAQEAYDRAGCVKLIEDREALIEALAADYVADREIPDFLMREDGKPSTRAILSGWNVDVAAINTAVRALMQEKGMLAADSVTIQATPRGGSKAQDLALAVGDEIIFGEQVKLDGVTIQNADIARIERIEGDPQDPRITFELKGQSVTAKASELVGWRDPEGDEPATPKMQHAYAMTIHASQGVTVDRTWVANIRGMGRESLYVAMTRHRHAVRMFAESGRIYDALMAKAGGKTAAVSSHGVSLPEEDDAPGNAEITPDAVKKALFEEGEKSDRKSNASDFAGNVRQWLGLPPAAPVAPEVAKVAAQETAPGIRDKLAVAAMGFRRFNMKPASPTPSPATPATVAPAPAAERAATPAQELAQRQQDRKTAPEGYKAQWRDSTPTGRVTQEEMDQFVKADLEQFAVQRLGYSPVKGERGAFMKEQLGPNGKPIKIAITNKGDKWLWAGARGEGEGGVIWKLVARDLGKSVGEALHWLRKELGTWKPDANFKANAVDRSQGIDPELVRKAVYRAGKMERGPSPYLVEERGLDPKLLNRLGADVKAEGADKFAAGNENGAAFIHRDAKGNITGYSRRGYERPDADGNIKSFRQARGEPNLWQANDGFGAPRRVYVSESAIDAISRYQLDGQPGSAMLTATEGQPSDRALAIYRELARKHPGVEWHVAMDDDKAGRDFAEKVKKALVEGDPDAKIIDRHSPPQFKDANDELRGITREQAEKNKAEKQAALDAQKDRQREQEEARRRAEEERKAEELRNRPRFR